MIANSATCRLTYRPDKNPLILTIPLFIDNVETGSLIIGREPSTGKVTIYDYRYPAEVNLTNVYFFEKDYENDGVDPHTFIIDVPKNRLLENLRNQFTFQTSQELLTALSNVQNDNLLAKRFIHMENDFKTFTRYESPMEVPLDVFNATTRVRLVPWGENVMVG